jgi:hypothetical protein
MCEPACDYELNDNGHPAHCECERCLPDGADGLQEDEDELLLAAE